MAVAVNSIRQFAATVRGRRLSLGLSQAELASRARVSRQWIIEFEAGKPTAELGLVLRLLEALELRLELSELEAASSGDSPPTVYTRSLDDLLDDYRKR